MCVGWAGEGSDVFPSSSLQTEKKRFPGFWDVPKKVVVGGGGIESESSFRPCQTKFRVLL